MAGVRIESSSRVTINQLNLTDPRPQVKAGVLILGNSTEIAAEGLQFTLAPGVPNLLRQTNIKLPPGAIVIQDMAPGYSEKGVWAASGLAGFGGTTTRYSFSTGAEARWTPTLESGDYTVFVYRVVHPSSDPKVNAEVVHAGGSDTQTLDYTSGSSGWIELGTYHFDASMNGYVKVSLTTGGSALRADAAAFVKR
jgi:hypothetical protein